MALDDPARTGPLPCGTAADDLIMQVTENSPPNDAAHQEACPHCRAALDAIRLAWADFQTSARSPVAVPDGLNDRIMRRIRSLARATGDGVMIASDLGETRIGTPVLAGLSRRAARSVEGVVWASATDITEDGGLPGSVQVAIRLVVELGAPIEQIAARVRDRVIAVVEGQAGTPVARVDVRVDDVSITENIS